MHRLFLNPHLVGPVIGTAKDTRPGGMCATLRITGAPLLQPTPVPCAHQL